MANSEPRRGNSAGNPSESSWENQIVYVRTDKGAELMVKNVIPSKDHGVLHFVRDSKTWERVPTPSFTASGAALSSSDQIVRHHTKVPVDFGMSATTDDSTTTTTTYSRKSLIPAKFTISGTFFDQLCGGLPPEYEAAACILEANSDKFEIGIDNGNKWKGLEFLAEGTWKLCIRHNAVRGKYEVWGFRPEEMTGPGAASDQAHFDKVVLYEADSYSIGEKTTFTAVDDSVSDYTFELTTDAYGHKITNYLIPNGISIYDIDYFLPGGFMSARWSKCAANDTAVWETELKEISGKRDESKEEMDTEYKAWKEAKDLLSHNGAERTQWYWYDLKNEEVEKINQLEDSIAQKKSELTQLEKAKDEANEARAKCNKANEYDGEDCHSECQTHCDQIDEYDVSIATLKAEVKDIEEQKTAAEENAATYKANVETWIDREDDENEKKKKYAEAFLTWYKNDRSAFHFDAVYNKLVSLNAFTADEVGCEGEA